MYFPKIPTMDGQHTHLEAIDRDAVLDESTLVHAYCIDPGGRHIGHLCNLWKGSDIFWMLNVLLKRFVLWLEKLSWQGSAYYSMNLCPGFLDPPFTFHSWFPKASARDHTTVSERAARARHRTARSCPHDVAQTCIFHMHVFRMHRVHQTRP